VGGRPRAGEGAPLFRSHRRVGGARLGGYCLRAALLACLLPFLCTCGLEETVELYPPSFTSGGGLITLVHNSGNTNEYFSGYEIYYRVYTTSDPDADTALAVATSDWTMAASTVQNTDIYTPTTALAKMQSLGFVRMLFNTDASNYLPSTLFASGNQITLYLTNNAVDWYYTSSADGDVAQTAAYRNSDPSSTTPVSFNTTYTAHSTGYSTTDVPLDYDSTASSGKNSSVYIVLFAVATGIDIDAGTQLCSYPAVSAIINYQLPQNLYDTRPSSK
jgi:hypothetical protein